jgi:hypothetical protein
MGKMNGDSSSHCEPFDELSKSVMGGGYCLCVVVLIPTGAEQGKDRDEFPRKRKAFAHCLGIKLKQQWVT